MKLFFVGAVASLSLLAVAPAFAADTSIPGRQAGIQLLSQEHIAKIREDIRINEGRAHELEPIIARDKQARHDVEVNWGVLERHARELHARANEYRTVAQSLAGRDQTDVNGWATQFDTIATHDEENARIQHEMADRLDRTIAGEAALRDSHLQTAQRLRDWLAAHGVN